ncbi:TIGR03503 family protein [Photobacterium andalusiense]|uniref:TIGR03503 family protein n=1 Tax=Photobacterium andalusiense TaxID=2204296 RepID=A0A1Y6MQE9_9GAMM|nr:TIGR03503 family protein [Photobacterium andalusiense]SMY38807.1 hypothetical protein PAND9192_03866 [Photobacterium andalusiense]
MLRRLWVLIFYVPLCAWAQTETRLTWLDNRFRVDPEIEQITFIVAREQPSQSVVLVAPNGHKYYADRHSKAMSWYSEQGMDIISIDHPMAGPWQALGKVSSNNGIKIVSNIELDVDPLPAQLYQTEVLKFRARLTQNKQPLLLRDFLDRVQLEVSFYPVNTDVDDVSAKESASIVVGTFADNGQGYDEIGGDGIFTVALSVDVVPGKYRVKIASVNGVFERAVEQTVLVYPSLITTTFIQSHQPLASHVVKVTANDQAVVGSLAAYLRVKQPQHQPQIIQTGVQPQQSQLILRWPNNRQVGKAWWAGWAYVTDTLTQRELVFRLAKQHYTHVAPVTVDTSSALTKQQREQQLAAEKTEQLQQRLLWLGVANLIVMISVMGWLQLWRRKRVPKPDLVIPK